MFMFESHNYTVLRALKTLKSQKFTSFCLILNFEHHGISMQEVTNNNFCYKNKYVFIEFNVISNQQLSPQYLYFMMFNVQARTTYSYFNSQFTRFF